MNAVPGDRLVVCGDPGRVAEVLAVLHADGTRPYVVRRIRTGHIAFVAPDSYATIIPAAAGMGAAAGTAETWPQRPGRRAARVT